MYQTIIRDSGGEGLIRVVSVPCGPGRAVVNGSLLIVPPGTVAYAAVNGMLSPPYGPGRHELFTGVDPFFVRLRHLMTRGDAGVTVSVFFLSTEKHCFLQLGTGELPLRERRFQITLKAFAACGLAVSIDDPLRVLQRLVGSYSTGFSEEDLEPCLQQLMLAPVREALSQELSRFDVTQMNSQLQRLSERVSPPVRAAFADYGLRLERLQVMAVNIPDGEIQRLYELEQELRCRQEPHRPRARSDQARLGRQRRPPHDRGDAARRWRRLRRRADAADDGDDADDARSARTDAVHAAALRPRGRKRDKPDTPAAHAPAHTPLPRLRRGARTGRAHLPALRAAFLRKDG